MKMQTDNIASKYDIDDITVVVGFKKDLIMERFPELTYVYNPFFDRTNTSKSFLQALKKQKGRGVLLFNVYVVLDEKLLSELFSYIKKDESFISVNTQSVSD